MKNLNYTFWLSLGLFVFSLFTTCRDNSPRPSYKVTFNSNGGSPVDSQTVLDGDSLTDLQETERDNYTFSGWYLNESLSIAFEIDKPIASDTVLYAKWVQNEHTITFDTDGGTIMDRVIVLNGDKLKAPTDPTKAYYTFEGWYLDVAFKTAFDFDILITSDMKRLVLRYYNRLMKLNSHH